MRSIELEEIRIGNYYSSNPDVWVSQISADDFMNIYVNGSDRWYAIPLTEKWLTDFGFKTMYDSEGYFLGSMVYYNGIMADSQTYKIEYVHQLQNLYFALTGQELTIPNTLLP